MQCKLQPKGGLGAATYETCITWCKLYRDKFAEKFSLNIKDVGILLGVIDVYKCISPQLKTSLKSFTDIEQNIYVLAVGVDESPQFFGVLSEHPMFKKHLFINHIQLADEIRIEKLSRCLNYGNKEARIERATFVVKQRIAKETSYDSIQSMGADVKDGGDIIFA